MPATDSLLFPDLNEGPDFQTETRLMGRGKSFVAGVDEAGRGPLAGPVVAAAVVLDPENTPDGLNDSKKLSEKRRELLFDEILRNSHVAWASLPASVIDRINIRAASLRAMEIAIEGLPVSADAVLVDGRDVPEKLRSIGTALVKGDSRSLSIAAASIVAKVVRDRMMVQSAIDYPDYGFERHKGYGSKLHRDAIATHGPCPLHRRSFSPISEITGSTRSGQ